MVLGGGQAAGDISIEEEGSFINCYLLWATELLPRGCGSASSKGDITTLAEEQYKGLRWKDPTKMEYFRTAKAILELWERAASLERYSTGSQFPTTRRQIDEATKKWIVCATLQGMDQSSRESAARSICTSSLKEAVMDLTQAAARWQKAKDDETLLK